MLSQPFEPHLLAKSSGWSPSCGNLQGGARKAAKYAAILALGAMDPVEANRHAAYAALRDFISTRLTLIHRHASTIPTGSTMHEQPEFILPYLIQVEASAMS